MQFSVCGSLNLFTFYSKSGQLHYIQHMFLYFIEDLTSNCLENKFAMQFCKFLTTWLLWLKGFMGCEISILFYFCDDAKIR